jgi:rubrerythrin
MSIFFSIREVIEMAVSTERSGQAFYQTASKLAKENNLKELFRYLAEEEEKHLKTFQGLYNLLKEKPEITPYNWEEAKLYLEALVDSKFFAGPDTAINLAKKAKDELEVIYAAIEFEKDTLLFFYQILEMIKSREQELVKKIIEEEKRHIQRLSTMKSKLS